jgi:hypothetical protein
MKCWPACTHSCMRNGDPAAILLGAGHNSAIQGGRSTIRKISNLLKNRHHISNARAA